MVRAGPLARPGPRRRPTALALALLLALAPVTSARADDGDGGGGGGAGAGAGGGGGPGGGGEGGGSEAGGGVQGFDLGPNPGTNPIRDAGRLFRSVFGGGTTPAAVAAAPPPPPPRASRAAPAPELVALRVQPAALPRLRAAGFAVLGERRTADGSLLLRLRAPARLDAAAAIAQLRGLAPGAVVDRNHLFRPVELGTPHPETIPVTEVVPAGGAACPVPPGLVALIDTAVEPAHPGLAGIRLERETLRGAGRRPSRSAHGTAVVLRLAPLLPGARVLAIDAFHLGPDGDAADAFDVAMALDRAAALGAGVVNLSLAGPANAVVAQLGAAAAARGSLIVAAAGNDGPRAPPRYPAAYPWAVAVTAVRGDAGRWAKAPVGAHIAFAAHGVELALPSRPGAPPRLWSGTSFAAPVVSAALAALPPAEPGAARLEALARRARDLGAPGRDPVFGWGEVAFTAACPPAQRLIAAGG